MSASFASSCGVVQTRASGIRSPTASTGSSLLGGDLRQLGDLAHDFDDVPVRVEDAQLPIGSIAATDDVLDPFELALDAQLACVRIDELQRAADHLRVGPAVAPSGAAERARPVQ